MIAIRHKVGVMPKVREKPAGLTMIVIRHKVGVMPKVRSRSCWEFKSSSEVRTFIESFTGTNREVQELAIEAHWNSPRRSLQSSGACRESAGASPRVRRMFAGSLREEAIDAPEHELQ